MTTADRYALLAKLPDAGPYTRYLAIERGAVPRAVVVSQAPASVSDDPAKLDALVRDAEAAARLRHAHVLPSLGLETVGDGTALVEAYRAGVTLRELLAAGGRLPAPVAGRIAADVCAALGKIHAFQTGDGRPLVHGHVGAEHVWIADGGEALLCGLGTGGGGSAVEDVRGAAAVLGECLSGEPVGERFDAPGVPPGVASVVSRYRSAASAVLGPAALGEAVAAAMKPGLAGRDAVAAWVDQVLPHAQGIRAERAQLLEDALGPEARFGGAAAGSRGKQKEADRPTPAPIPHDDHEQDDELPAEEIAVDQIIDTASLRAKTVPMLRAVTDEDILAMAVEPTPVAVPAPSPAATPPDAARAFPAPAAPAASRGRFLALVAAAFALVGFLGGFAFSRAGSPPPPPRSASVSAAAPAAPSTPARPAPAPEPPPAPKAVPAAAKRPASPPARRAAAPAPAPAPSPGSSDREHVLGGLLTVTAPDGASVLLDGKPLGTGSLKKTIPAGNHRVEVQFRGAQVGEDFEMLSGGTYEYQVRAK
ncbi:MAG: PEGA domain-containing protein [Anaeromyxobacteraceae bacterium]